jgi:hypothetical protein
VKNPKNKGGSFERDVARTLSLWVSNNRHDDLIWRTATSGAKATVSVRSGKKVKTHIGDLMAVERHREANVLTSRFIIECKHVRNLRWDALVYGTPESGNTIIPFWRKLLREANTHKRMPMLIAKQNGVNPVMAIQFSIKGLMPLIVCHRFSDPMYVYNLEVVVGTSFLSFMKQRIIL